MNIIGRNGEPPVPVPLRVEFSGSCQRGCLDLAAFPIIHWCRMESDSESRIESYFEMDVSDVREP